MVKKIKIAIFPERNLPSFQWVVRDIFNYATKADMNVEATYFNSIEDIGNEYHVIVFFKTLPSASQLILLKDKVLCWLPIDSIFSHEDLHKLTPIISKLDYALVHNSILVNYLPKSLKIHFIDHYQKYTVTRSNRQKKFLWIGVLEYIPRTIEYLSQQTFLNTKNLVLLTNLEHVKTFHDDIIFTLNTLKINVSIVYNVNSVVINGFLFEQWTEERQSQELSCCKALVDIKSTSFRHQIKPPTKAQIYAATGVPVFLNKDHPAIKIMARDQIFFKTIDELALLDNAQITDYSQNMCNKIADKYSIESVALQYLSFFEEASSCTRKSATWSPLVLKIELKIRSILDSIRIKIYGQRDKFL